MMQEDTIAAIATGMSNAGIGIVRVSGMHAISIVNQLFVPHRKTHTIDQLKTYQAAYGEIIVNGQVIDEAICLVMHGPNSYTAEDVVEIQSHGGIVVVRKILEAVMNKGARIAEPGEFTKRAFLNGRIDLSQAESVMDLIHSKNEFAAYSSVQQLKGSLSICIKNMRKKLLHEIAYIESALDDPENYSLDGYGIKLKQLLDLMQGDIQHLLNTADDGKLLREGIKTVIVGKPNAGKSSLLNALLGQERAIVTEIEGTTRDTLEEEIQIQGIPLRIIDTAGIRMTDDIVEKIGVDKAKQSIEQADLVLYVVDGSRPLNDDDKQIIELIRDKKVITLINKSDLDVVVDKLFIKDIFIHNIVDISVKNTDGMEEIYEILKEMFFHGELTFNDEIYITNMRHKNALIQANRSLEQVILSIHDDMPEDFYSIDLMAAYTFLGYIVGEAVEDDLVNEIFREFCMGK